MRISIYKNYKKGGAPAEEALALTLYLMGMSMNAIANLLKVSTRDILSWIKKFALDTYEKPAPAQAVVVELDEMRRLLNSKNKLWICKAYCRDAGQLIDWECEGRDKATFEKLMERIKNVRSNCIVLIIGQGSQR